MYIYISAEASMASGRVEAEPSLLKALQSANFGEGFSPLTPPTAPSHSAVQNTESAISLDFWYNYCW